MKYWPDSDVGYPWMQQLYGVRQREGFFDWFPHHLLGVGTVELVPADSELAVSELPGGHEWQCSAGRSTARGCLLPAAPAEGRPAATQAEMGAAVDLERHAAEVYGVAQPWLPRSRFYDMPGWWKRRKLREGASP